MLPAKASKLAVEAVAPHGHFPWALSPQIWLEFAEAGEGVSVLHFSPYPNLQSSVWAASR